MTRRLNDLYDQIYKAEDLLQESMMKKATLESEQMSVQSMIGILSSFDAIYDRMNAAERRDLVKYLISEVELFPREEQKTQKRFVKAIAYKFPIEQKVLTQFDECGASVESVALLERKPAYMEQDFRSISSIQYNLCKTAKLSIAVTASRFFSRIFAICILLPGNLWYDLLR